MEQNIISTCRCGGKCQPEIKYSGVAMGYAASASEEMHLKLTQIQCLVDTYPNDQELGKELRKFINQTKENTKENIKEKKPSKLKIFSEIDMLASLWKNIKK